MYCGDPEECQEWFEDDPSSDEECGAVDERVASENNTDKADGWDDEGVSELDDDNGWMDINQEHMEIYGSVPDEYQEWFENDPSSE